MGVSCREDEYRDALIKKCLSCDVECKRPYVIPRCTRYCVSASCRAQPGHYYDGLLKKCVGCDEVCGRHPAECSQHCKMSAGCKAEPGHYYDGLLKKCVRCDEVCGRHPAECSQHCKTASPPPVTTKKLLVGVSSHLSYSKMSTAIEDSTILLYPLLAVCMLLLLLSLSLALVVFLRGSRAKLSKPGPKEANQNRDCVVQMGQEVGQSGCQPGHSSTDFATTVSHPTDREASDDSSPTETCVCVHCFPDLKALGHGNDRPLRAPFPLYPQAALHRDQIQNGGPAWTKGNLDTSGQEVQEEAAVG
ncbi:tumor necrosis factor receptor superfamily member 13B [Chaetodon trifascialis]|uniref:tumor necrosis factor receptor superfamily member 13B n=1 Tax=Chaetodon trifascialis TaxID=109706 RepID=UPI0039926983